MTRKHEELVGEVSERIQFVADIGLQSFHAESAVEWAAEKEKRGRALAQGLIALILSAFRDGRLELPGEVGRWNLTDIYAPTGKWLQSWLKEMMFKKGMHTLIALSGTSQGEPVGGKEEGENGTQ